MSLRGAFNLYERLKFTFQADVLNVTNNVRFVAPNVVVDSNGGTLSRPSVRSPALSTPPGTSQFRVASTSLLTDSLLQQKFMSRYTCRSSRQKTQLDVVEENSSRRKESRKDVVLDRLPGGNGKQSAVEAGDVFKEYKLRIVHLNDACDGKSKRLAC